MVKIQDKQTQCCYVQNTQNSYKSLLVCVETDLRPPCTLHILSGGRRGHPTHHPHHTHTYKRLLTEHLPSPTARDWRVHTIHTTIHPHPRTCHSRHTRKVHVTPTTHKGDTQQTLNTCHSRIRLRKYTSPSPNKHRGTSNTCHPKLTLRRYASPPTYTHTKGHSNPSP